LLSGGVGLVWPLSYVLSWGLCETERADRLRRRCLGAENMAACLRDPSNSWYSWRFAGLSSDSALSRGNEGSSGVVAVLALVILSRIK